MAWDRHSIGLMRRGVVSARSARKRGGDPPFDGLHRDEGGHDGGFIAHDEILDHPGLQGGRAAYGRRMSRGGSAGAERSPGGSRHIDSQNRRTWPQHGAVRAANRNTVDRHGESWMAKNAPRSLAKKWSSNEYYPDAHYGDPPGRQR